MEFKASHHFGLLIFAAVTHEALAGGLKLTPNLGLTHLYTDNLNVQDQHQQSEQITELTAGINLSNQGRNVESNLNYRYRHFNYVNRDDLNKGFSSFDGQLLFKLLDNRLTSRLSASKKRQQASLTSPSTIYSDTGQTDVTHYNINNNFVSKFEDVMDYNISWKLSKTQADTVNKDELSSLTDSHQHQISLSLNNGDYFKDSYWSLSAHHSIINYAPQHNTQRAQQQLSNYQAELGQAIAYDISFFAQYFNEDYDVNERSSSPLASSSYGAGLRWQPSSHSYFKLAYNWSLNDLNSNFISANINWQPSLRTSLSLSSSKRYFGDAYEAKFNHRHKRIQTNISYTESVTNYQIASSNNSSSHFICPNTPTYTFSQCTLATSTTPSLGTGQQLIPYDHFSGELNNNTYLSKQWNIGVSYRFRRANFQLTYYNTNQAQIDSLDHNNRERLSINTSYQTSRRSSFNLSAHHEKYQHLDSNVLVSEYREELYTLSHKRSLINKLSLSVAIMNRQRESTIAVNNFSENRVNFSLIKEF